MARAEDPDDRKTRGGRGGGDEHGRRSSHRGEQLVRAGTLLVSSTELVEPTFRRTVIYIIEHNDAGSLGVVINRPSDTAVHDVLPQWAEVAAAPRTLFVGGPVKRDAALCLGTLRVGASIDGVDGLRRIDGRVVLIDLDSDPAEIAPLVEGIRVFAGYAGWTFGQLEGELEQDDWIVLSALPGDPITTRRTDLWGHVLRRQPLPLSLLATHPIEVERN
ncbi:YqgE/AlgH family protein [Nocardia cyriacigeorgica]|uniref:YqgE/AlgH family protein n=1 Tax=Nocardia cyriacigeorgica TaxID=135487 RepID=UPI002453C08B|nr:YqgE/AlgH family protein [Nocardia cyriacigeorgica]